MEYTHLVSVAALVTNENGEILLVKSPWRGWEYPGGLIEPGETFQEALKREVQEEAGVEIEVTGFVGICKNVGKDIVNIDFTARYLGGYLTTSDESTEVIWATPEKALELITFPLTKKRLQNMLSGSKEATLFCFHRENGFEVTEDKDYPIGIKKEEH
jgi:8-oxo-dGTP diphosphatase